MKRGLELSMEPMEPKTVQAAVVRLNTILFALQYNLWAPCGTLCSTSEHSGGHIEGL